MDKTLFESLKQSLKETAAILRGKIAPGKVTESGAPDAKSMRPKIGLSQNEFAQLKLGAASPPTHQPRCRPADHCRERTRSSASCIALVIALHTSVFQRTASA